MAQNTIVITGGSRGIGRALVRSFLYEGCRVITCGRAPEALEALHAEVLHAYPGQLHTHACDLSTHEGQQSFIQHIAALQTDVDVLVNNTGVFMPGSIAHEAPDAFAIQMNTNVASAYFITRALLPGMLARQAGYVFTICSTASFMAYPNGGSYCISKFALLGFTKVLREDLKDKGIRVTAVMPGATRIARAVVDAWKMPARTVIEELVIRPQLGDIA
jgi:short-subunit dehydrogenase